ncbi:chitin synthase chs-2-like [Cylas formicarius]|uniref:chitin synthase chs-2-like n=1 Tax=Cylas formicarius TaxID=197179 RepID=UPI002958A69F|nr:chitin synthase chs-2-like [Cylas formicarius]
MWQNFSSDDDDEEFDDEDILLDSLDRKGEEVKPWDTFQIIHRKNKQGSAAEAKWIDNGVKVLKLATIVLVFITVLGSAVVSKGTILFMASQVKKNITRAYCNQKLDVQRQYIVTIPDNERAAWIWLIIFTYFVPELSTFVRSLRICLFKTWTVPRPMYFFSLVLTETLPAIGSALLIFAVLPDMDVIKAAMLTNAVCIIPAIGMLLKHLKWPKMDDCFTMLIDLVAIVAQLSALLLWPLLENRPDYWPISAALAFISFGWWENFIPINTSLKCLTRTAQERKEFPNSKYFCYTFISVWKCLVFFATTLAILYIREGDVTFLFEKFQEAFSSRFLRIVEVQPSVSRSDSKYSEAVSTGNSEIIETNVWDQWIVWFINIGATYICYASAKFASKVMIQGASFAFPVCLSVPVLISGLVAMCGIYTKDECAYTNVIPPYLFFNTLPLTYLRDFVGHHHTWLWLLWLLSQVWITQHIWFNRNKVLSTTEKLFMRPMYDAFLIDQSIALNRRVLVEEVEKHTHKTESDAVKEDSVTKIYACGTMWHETKEEMMEFLKSILRVDEDQCAQRIVRKHFEYERDDYYEWETHIFFDDAFVRKSKDDNDPHLNQYVMDLVETVGEAATEVHQTTVRIRPPVVYPTPYGGRLVWVLPGKTKMIAHLKDKAKIRAKKRWSQVMYMYYLLGHKIMDNDELTAERVKTISKNTFILALDGDIDFQPQAVHLLVQYMKKNDALGAACGRIHPVGSGAIAWYQIFEYAVGHWMQKATEHVIGCVLCSPGCFSLFRASALMDHNVMARYTTKSEEARHYVQYDQGEDRWLCTLLLQRGYRVEYSAASDAYTHCPEGFNEFYNQRRRWMPSTMANIMDLLQDSDHIVKVNDNISKFYIFYQIILMIGTVIGPGTIFLMLVGAFVAAFKLTQFASFLCNIIPILIFVLTCIFCKSDTQLTVAAIISGIYGLIMMAVLVGIMMQINEDGILAPSSMFFFLMAGEFVVAGIIHPKEFYCLPYGVIYYVTVPSMYMLLVIYSVFNMNNVSWGTREITVVANTTPEKAEAQAKKKKQSLIVQWLNSAAEFCCRRENSDLKWIQTSLQHIEQKLDYIERVQLLPENAEPRKTTSKRKTTIIEGSRASMLGPRVSRMSGLPRQSILPNKSKTAADSQSDGFQEEAYDEFYEDDSTISQSDDLQENSWFYDGELIRGHVTYLDKNEETFWKELLDKYLHPIEDNKEKIAVDLKDLRDRMVMSFFMINALFVLVVFLLTLQKDLIHVNWPFNPKVNFTYTLASTKNEIIVSKTYLELEPIGFVFLIFFFFLMLIQFGCMFVHRWATFSQILANTDLDLSLFETSIENLTADELFAKDPLKTVRKLIKLKGINGDDQEKNSEQPVSRRNTVAELVRNRQNRIAKINCLYKAFAIRMAKINRGETSDTQVPKKMLSAIQRRRTTIMRRKSQMPRPDPTRDDRDILKTNNGGMANDYQFDNPAYEGDSQT